ncbi:hypothetical protein [Brevundimonas sp. FT23028]|jgi:hypothetical protein|uniref:hypothetical protein n=1 Tax=Brevundimonas sp. FT23028 TaxID=3393748 RepID=UPI003B58A167
MKFLLGVLSLAIGLEGLWSAIRHRRLRDKSGWIYARVERQPLYFWVMTAVFVLMVGTGCLLLFAAIM